MAKNTNSDDLSSLHTIENQKVVEQPAAEPALGGALPIADDSQLITASEPSDNAPAQLDEEDQNALDDLEDIEFLLDEIEDQIAPLAL